MIKKHLFNIYKIINKRKFLLWKQLLRTTRSTSIVLTFNYFKSITYTQSNPIYLTFFKKPTLFRFWSKIHWASYVGRYYDFNEEFVNYRYFCDVRLLQSRHKQLTTNTSLPSDFFLNVKNKRNLLLLFINTYVLMFLKIYFERHFWFKHYTEDEILKAIMNLSLTFRKNQIFLHLWDLKKRDYCFVSLGFFIKFFAKKKSLKKNKVIKFLLARFIRKLFIISNILMANLIIRGLPIKLLEMTSFIMQPLKHKFTDPEDGNVIDETKTQIESPYRITFNYMLFIKNKAFGYVRLRKKGRIKRKLVRKLIKRGNVTD